MFFMKWIEGYRRVLNLGYRGSGLFIFFCKVDVVKIIFFDSLCFFKISKEIDIVMVVYVNLFL